MPLKGNTLSFPSGDAPSASLWMLRDRDRFAQDDKAIVILRAASRPKDLAFMPLKGNTISFPSGDAPSALLWMLHDRDRFAHSG